MSRVVTGKKNTVTVRKIKKQRRILCDTMVHLHKKFTAEHKHVSYSFFCAQRPFWVTQPKEADRDTCLCKTHENLQYMADKLFSLGILTSKNLEEMADATVCDMTKKRVCIWPVQGMQDDYMFTLQIPSEQRGKSDSVVP